MKLTVLTWLWRQPKSRTAYTAEHVNIWAAMVRRHLSMEFELACVTNMPEGIDTSIRIIAPPGEFEDVTIPTWSDARAKGLPQCFRRLVMFAPHAADIFGDRFVSMDLDCVIGSSLDPLFDHDHDFRMYRGTNAARPYNGSMVQMTAGCRPNVYTEFTQERAIEAGQKFLGSDQAWISYQLGWGEADWGHEHGVHWYGSQHNRKAKDRRIMFFPGHPKPWQILGGPEEHDRWIVANYHTNLEDAA